MSRLRLAAALLALALPLSAQTTATPPPTHPTSAPYTGDLSVFEDADRAEKLQIDRVMDTLKLRPGANVADIGAGGGWFSVRAARRVAGGPNGGTVFAEDINPHAVDAIHDRAVKEHLSNIAAVLGTPDDPKLPADSLDAALMLRVYHEVAHPPTLLANLRTSMKSGGLFGVIDHPGNGSDHGINADVVIAEVQSAGFRFIKQYDFTKGDQNDYFLVFEKP
jgi:ubiquinone/menaquinone biosynthesis C-methylase UbiE